MSTEELARFRSERFGRDLWSTGGYIQDEKTRREKFRLADVRLKDGQIRIETRTGCFSSGGVWSNFALEGDFDIQVDCRVEFMKERSDMDQVAGFNVLDTTKELIDSEMTGAQIVLMARSGWSGIMSSYRVGEDRLNRVSRAIADFDGCLRMVRKGKRIGTMFKRSGESEWTRLGQFTHTAVPMVVTLMGQNYVPARKNIGAESAFVVIFDNFRFNAAEKIVESEI